MSNYLLRGNNIEVIVDSKQNTVAVKKNGTVWNMTEEPFVKFSDESVCALKCPVKEAEYETTILKGVSFEYENIGERDITVKTTIELEKMTDNVIFSALVQNDKQGEVASVSFPAPFDFGEKYGDSGETNDKHLPECYTVLPRMQGMLVPAGTKIILYDKGILYERDARMAFFGQIRRNDGYIAIFENPYDAMYELRNDEGEKAAPMWRPSLGRMGYKRKMRYAFLENCSYIEIAKAYKDYVKSKGEYITLKEKIAKNEKVKEMIGSPIVIAWIAANKSPESPYYNKEKPEANDTFVPFEVYEEKIKKLYDKGLKKAYVHLDGWGNMGFDNRHPCPMPPHERAGGHEGMKKLFDTVKNCGYIFALHDNYRDFYFTSPDFSFDKATMNADGTNHVENLWLGGNQAILCASVARDYVRSNYLQMEKYGINVDSTYFDVFSCVSPDECYNPEHPMTREQCVQYRKECFEFMNSRGVFCGSEEANDCIISTLVYCHYEPYRTEPLISNTGSTKGILVPLFNLVYHECLIVPWRSDKGVRGGVGIPATDSAYDHAILNGGPVTLSIDADDKHIEEAVFACENFAKVALMPMINHEFLSDDRRIQRTTFKGDGEIVTIEVNLDTEEYNISAEKE